jgi:hypothetical protein
LKKGKNKLINAFNRNQNKNTDECRNRKPVFIGSTIVWPCHVKISRCFENQDQNNAPSLKKGIARKGNSCEERKSRKECGGLMVPLYS